MNYITAFKIWKELYRIKEGSKVKFTTNTWNVYIPGASLNDFVAKDRINLKREYTINCLDMFGLFIKELRAFVPYTVVEPVKK